MTKVEATDGILIRINADLYQNAELLELSSKIRNLATKYGGTVEKLQMSQTQLTLFVEFNKNKRKKEFLKDAADLI